MIYEFIPPFAFKRMKIRKVTEKKISIFRLKIFVQSHFDVMAHSTNEYCGLMVNEGEDDK
jgi:hypothetical protein